MKIEVVRQYKSIKSLPDISLPDFTILTGTNGSGKTHLLEGITAGYIHLEIEERKVNSIVHFNYQDFVVKKIHTSKQTQQRQQRQQRQQEIKQRHNEDAIKEELKTIKGMLKSFFPINLNKIIESHENAQIYTWLFDKMFFNNIDLLDGIPNIDEAIEFVTERNRNGENSTIQREEIETAYGKVADHVKSIRTALENDNLAQKYYTISQKMGIPFIQLGAHHFKYQENVLGEKLMSEIKNYRIEQARNDFNKIRKDRGEEVDYLNEKEFRAHNGIPPWELLNEVLGEYTCNGYLIASERLPYPQLEQNLEVFQAPLYFVNESTADNIGVEDLSSGEKTLLALALMIYQQRGMGTFSEVLLLDEIDGNLHPSMIRQLLDALENIFVKKYKMKIILVTHSPTTIALAPDDSIFTMYRETENQKRIQKQSKSDALKILTEGYATLEEGLMLFDQISSKEISIFTEGHNAQYLEKANQFFGDQNRIEVVMGIADRSGKDQLRTLYNFFTKVQHDKKVVFVWDCDAQKAKNLSEDNNTVPYVLPKNADNKIIENGIENIFPESLISDEFYKPETTNSSGTKIRLLDKNKLRKHLIDHGEEKDFRCFKIFFDFLKTHHLQ